MHKIRALCPLIRTETLKKVTAGRGEYDRLPKMMPQLIEKLQMISLKCYKFLFFASKTGLSILRVL